MYKVGFRDSKVSLDAQCSTNCGFFFFFFFFSENLFSVILLANEHCYCMTKIRQFMRDDWHEYKHLYFQWKQEKQYKIAGAQIHLIEI